MNKKYLNWKKLAQIMIIVVVIEALFLLGAFHQINYKSNNQAQSVTDENVGEIKYQLKLEHMNEIILEQFLLH